jgi:hypothetical protein
MGNKNVIRRAPARRAATFLAVLGALVMSSGVALMVAATPAGAAATKVPICHATSSDTNPYTFILVDDDSKKFEAHLAHRDDPNKTWKTDGSFGGVDHDADQPKPDIIGSYTDSDDVFHEMDGKVDSARCNANVEGPDEALTTAGVTFSDPNCANANVAGFSTSGEHVTFAITEGSKTPGTAITVTATADDGFVFEGDTDELDFKHTYGAAEADCTKVAPPTTTTNPTTVVSPPKAETKTESTAVTPTVVSAGLAGASVEDVRGEQGLALMFAGMVMLVAAGGLGLRVRGAASRI